MASTPTRQIGAREHLRARPRRARVETVYQLPGIGRLLIGALSGEQGFDRPEIMAVVTVVGAAIILLNLVADAALAVVDPTIEAMPRRRARATRGVI